MAARNTIKIKQIDNNDLFLWLQASLGQTIVPDSLQISHNYNEIFGGSLYTNGPFIDYGESFFSGLATFQSGATVNNNLRVAGLISGQSLSIQNFSIPLGSFGAASIGGLVLTGIPIFDSGYAISGTLLPSGTIFGVKQVINAPTFEKDASGQLMPATGLGTSTVMLCMSLG